MPAATGDARSARVALRRFGLVVGSVFVLLGSFLWWRGHGGVARLMWTGGAPLIVTACLAPGLLAPVERAWMRMAEVLGRINTHIILSLLYLVLLTPIALLRRVAGDQLDRRMNDGKPSYWHPREREPVDPARYRQQF